MHDCVRDSIASDRLGLRLYLFNKNSTNDTLNEQDMNSIFNLHRPKIEQQIASKLD